MSMATEARVGPKHVTPVGWGKKIKEAVWGGGLCFFTLYAPSGQGCRDGVATQLGTNSTVGS